ncbi:MAG: hypothetical protein R3B57_02920 [Phycisphaerales bacterium]
MGRMLIAVVVAAVVWFAWGFLSWSVLPMHEQTMRSVPDSAKLAVALQENLPETGLYYFPSPPKNADGSAPSEEQMTAWNEVHKQGPIGTIAYRTEGRDAMSPMLLVKGFALNLVSAIALVIVLANVRGFGRRLLAGLCVGVVAAMVGPMADEVWLATPMDFSLAIALDSVVAPTLAALVVAPIIGKGRKAKPAPDAD